ncbi:NAD(P)H-hydrate dehydratase [bacterium]|nr:NAD(P)H-hydrate dehydratase [bacterium]
MEFRLPERIEISNKSTYGRVLNIAGSDYMPGAAYLSSVSALKVGCGYCFLATSKKVISTVAAKSSNIVFVDPKNIIKAMQTADVIEIGCGLSTNYSGKKVFNKFIKYAPSQTPIIVDADGLNLISEKNAEFIKRKFQKVIFTPHPLEAARLLNTDSVLDNIAGAAKLISEKYNCITVLKTHNTFIYSPDGRSYTNTTGNSSMAKAGSGDVLTGMIAGLVAQGMGLFEAAALAVHLHGLCGDIAKEKLTEYSVMAEDLISSIHLAINSYLK